MVKAAIGLLLGVWIVMGQTDGASPRFEVASIKSGRDPLPNVRSGESVDAKPGTLTMHSARLSTAIAWAYDAQEYQITGPDWIFQQRYDIVAKAADGASVDALRACLRRLLAERFQATVHRQTKDLEGLVLTIGKGGHKLQEAKEPGSVEQTKLGAVSKGGTLSDLLAIAKRELRMPAVDQTGLTGHYNFTLDFAPYITPETNGMGDQLNVIALAFRDELGLKLESRKVPVEMVVVDKADKQPAEN